MEGRVAKNDLCYTEMVPFLSRWTISIRMQLIHIWASLALLALRLSVRTTKKREEADRNAIKQEHGGKND